MSSTKSLYAPLDHSVIDSDAFADLCGEAVRLLTIVARQWNGSNNGRLHASYSYCKVRGIGSKGTLQKAVAALISHGFLFRTRSHGFVEGKNIAASYALTWRPLTKNRKGLWCDGFVMGAYKKWKAEEISEGQKKNHTSVRNCTFSLKKEHQNRVSKTVLSKHARGFTESPQTEPYELLAIKEGFTGGGTLASVAEKRGVIVKNLVATCQSSLSGKVLSFRQLAESSNRYTYKPARLAVTAQGATQWQ